MKYALLSVSDKTGIVDFASQLQKLGFGILSTGGTFQLLSEHGIEVTEVSTYTGVDEMMAGRVKTLHPKIHGGILARRGVDDAVMATHGITAIDIVAVNLYPFAQTIADPQVSLELAIENIDIGGPAMVRSAAKNHAHVGIITSPSDYDGVITELQHQQHLSDDTRFRLALKAFEHTAHYDSLIAQFLSTKLPQSNSDNTTSARFSQTLTLPFSKVQELRYGENPHQHAALYRQTNKDGIATAKQWQGKPLSYNNIADTDAAWVCVSSFDQPACVIVKHANPCGVAVAEDNLSAYRLAYATDPESAFGGIIAFNRPLDRHTAKAIIDKQFVEVIIAPSIDDDALAITQSKKNVRVLSSTLPKYTNDFDFKRITGGLLVQSHDLAPLNKSDLSVVTKVKPSDDELDDLLFAWTVAKYVKSNAIVYAKNHQTIGIGAGQMSRVNSARIAIIKAEHAKLSVAGSVMASDAFFPFRDGIDNAAAAGVACIIQPGGSVRDEEVIAAADEHGMAMVFTGIRHFRH